MSKGTTFYAVKSGRNPGIYTDWTSCEDQVKGFSGAKFQKFGQILDAEMWLSGVTQSNVTSSEEGEIKKICIWTDGACRRNGLSQPTAGIGVWFGESDPRNLSQRLEGKQTNQRAELMAALKGLEIVQHTEPDDVEIELISDSQYLLKGA
eukprot:TRINITY_DN15331_c0_g1_i1.p1 TRINITY_DN15331_c0_g1~~TRINITY_DN15331_c0_g1_i1.p1  ORF type:complete len:150 (+),score=18.90 TRINITY_DN15331_c0_g1_i1:84-533(+)